MKFCFVILTLIVIFQSVYANEKPNQQRLDEIIRRGSVIMPFDLELTQHIFNKTEKGGVQSVIAIESADTDQIDQIRRHLKQISQQFQSSDFSAPAKIHGTNMPGLNVLQHAALNQISIIYSDIPKGARISYVSKVPKLVTAIHQWFDAQLNDHARHAVSGHDHHVP